MGIVQPGLNQFRPQSAGQWCEHQVLRHLELGLSDAFQIFHGVDWSSVHEGRQWFGELDAVVMAPNGNLVILEVKSGDLEVRDTGLYKHYGGQVKNVGHQSRQQHSAIRVRLRQAGWTGIHVGHLLVLPDARIAQDTIAYPRERIVDATEQDDLCRRVTEAISSAGQESLDLERLRQFLLDQFDLQPDPTARIGQLNEAVRVMSDGLAQWVPCIQHSGGVFQIQATGGSGKTQLALRLLKDAASNHQRARYVCFNRPLCDHLARIAPPQVEVITFHQLARDCWERQHGEPDFGNADIFDRMVHHYAQWMQSQPPTVDLLIVDESQDFDAAWVTALIGALRPTGKLYLMGDDDQAIYGRESPTIAEAVTITTQDNFRSPRSIVDTINLLGLAKQPIRARSPVDGELPGWHVYDSAQDAGGIKATNNVVKKLLQDGFTTQQIVLLTLRGKAHSRLLAESHLGNMALRTFTGRYDTAGNPIWSQGELFADTVMRFKGCAAPVVVLCEMEFTELDDATRRKLFVAFTRAQYRLECVLTASAERAMSAALAAT